jgi:hypothetical protein
MTMPIGKIMASDVADGWETFTPAQLIYAESQRCPCGAGMAYVRGMGPPGFWDCSAILLGQGDMAAKHEARLPFVFYEVRSEEQPGAGTTRP